MGKPRKSGFIFVSIATFRKSSAALPNMTFFYEILSSRGLRMLTFHVSSFLKIVF